MLVLPPNLTFTTGQLLALGNTISGVKHAARRGHVVRLRHGVYARPDAASPALLDLAAASSHRDLVLSDESAARVHAIPLVAVFRRAVRMTVPPGTNANLPGMHLYRARLRAHEVSSVDGLRVTSPARTVCDLARHHPLITSVPAFDHVLHNRLASADELRDVLAFCREWPGARQARRAARLCDSRAESPLESISRLLFPKLGLPLPDSQVIILDSADEQIARLDFYWDEFGVAGEADGRSKYADYDVILSEKDRHDDLGHTNLEVSRWGWTRAWREPRMLDRRLRASFAKGAARDRAGLPRLWTAVPTERIAVL